MYALLLVSLSMALVGDDVAVFKAGTDQEVLQAIAKRYVANRECVERCKATFVRMEGRAPNVEAARRGELEDLVKAKGVYVFDGSRKRFECLFDDDAIKSHTSPDFKPSPTGGERSAVCEFMSTLLLADGSSTLVYHRSYNPFSNEFDRVADIHEAEKVPASGYIWFPLGLGLYHSTPSEGAGETLERAWDLLPPKAVELKQDAPYGDRMVHVVTLGYEGGDATYWVDYKRGCIPLRELHRSAKEDDYQETYREQVSLIGGKLWFPSRMVHYISLTRRVRIIEVESIQINTPVSEADLTIRFPEPVGITDLAHRRGYSKATSFSLSKLDHPDKAASHPIRIATSAPPPLGAPALPGEIESSRSWIAYLGLSIASVLVVLVICRVLHAKRGSHVGRV